MPHIYALLLAAVVWAGFTPANPAWMAEAVQEDADQASFFSGVASEVTTEKVTVSRAILGKNPEKRTFVITEETKIEGKLKNNSRVTVRFSGDTAISIVVRDKAAKKKP